MASYRSEISSQLRLVFGHTLQMSEIIFRKPKIERETFLLQKLLLHAKMASIDVFYAHEMMQPAET